jgi:transcriptional regulator with AAA-type ATPase domain
VKRRSHTLLCWHAERAGIEVLEKTIAKLQKKVELGKVVYLLQENSLTGSTIPDQFDGVAMKKVTVSISDPTDHQAIYEFVRDQIVPSVRECEDYLHINISPGTPAMHSVWLMLAAGGAFPVGTKLWSSQFNPETKRTSLKAVEFSITTYMAEIRKEQQLNPARAVFEPEPKSYQRRSALQRLKRFAGLNGHPLLILGERGTGKTRLVETYVGKIKQREVVALACGGLNSNVAESLIFGHIKGAFTGADRDRTGLLGESNGKILFLDEVQDLPKSVQRELVRTLQDRDHKYRQIGSDKELTSDFELVCASNLSFDQLRDALYPDFFDRLAHLIIEVPPLRACREDIPLDWERIWKESRRVESLPDTAPLNSRLTDIFSTQPFNGNYRDLQRLAILLMAWLGEQTVDEAVDTAIDEWHKWDRKITPDNKFGSGTWQERTAHFQQGMASWAVSSFGTVKEAAQQLECSARTLTDHLKKRQ